MTDPATITTTQLLAALGSWGIDTDDLASVRLDADPRGGSLELRRWRKCPDGSLIWAGGDPATVTTVVGIERPERAS